jgi:hypothetical protein
MKLKKDAVVYVINNFSEVNEENVRYCFIKENPGMGLIHFKDSELEPVQYFNRPLIGIQEWEDEYEQIIQNF